mgnify:FL=1
MGVVGDVLVSSGATTTIKMHSTLTGTGTCLEMRTPLGVTVRIYPSASGTPSGYAMVVEAGVCN